MKIKAGDRTRIMGILNVTPDSFSDGGRYVGAEAAFQHAKGMIGEGADIIDVGGESTRPGAESVPLDEELRRVIPLIRRLAESKVPVSIDSYKPEVAGKALDAGASMVNDVYGLRADGMAELVAEYDVPVCIMHMQGTPKNMQENPTYRDVVAEVTAFLKERAEYAASKGVRKENIILDPGIGFGKTLEHNLEILRRIDEFRKLGFPLMVGHSRKSFIGKALDLPVEQRLPATVAVTAYLALHGVEVMRVHDVRENREAVELVGMLKSRRNA